MYDRTQDVKRIQIICVMSCDMIFCFKVLKRTKTKISSFCSNFQQRRLEGILPILIERETTDMNFFLARIKNKKVVILFQ
jgi:hypothetical protein